MEFIDGWDVHELLRRARKASFELPVPLGLFIIAETCRALAYAHAKKHKGKPLSIVHRDVSPHNILVSDQGEVKLTDFGIARAADRVRVTATGIIRGKPWYMSPEQARGQEIDARTDLFALGLSLWEALTARRAIDIAQDEQALFHLIDGDVPSPRTVRPEIPAELEAIVLGLLRRDREQRTPSAKVLLEQLARPQEPAAPYPEGRRLLAAEVTLAIEGEKTRKVSFTDSERPTESIVGSPVIDPTKKLVGQ
jgi:serine/threonine-protein kinase